MRRFGFHGLSYKFIADALKRQAPEVAGGKVVAALLVIPTDEEQVIADEALAILRAG